MTLSPQIISSLVHDARRQARKRKRRSPTTTTYVAEMTTVLSDGTSCEHKYTMQKSARVLGPYRNGDKWRLVVLDGGSRKAVVAETHEAALALRDDLQGALKKHIARSFKEPRRSRSQPGHRRQGEADAASIPPARRTAHGD
jgi:hypothetical protein